MDSESVRMALPRATNWVEAGDPPHGTQSIRRAFLILRVLSSAADCATMSAPAQDPTAAEAQRVAAVLRPRTFMPSFIMAPAPKNPMPDTT